MTVRKTPKGKVGAKKLKLKKETIKDLDATRKGAKVKGGGLVEYGTFACSQYVCATVNTNCNCGPPRATTNVWCL